MAETRIIITDTNIEQGLINVRIESTPALPHKAEEMTPGQRYGASILEEIADSLAEDELNRASGALN